MYEYYITHEQIVMRSEGNLVGQSLSPVPPPQRIENCLKILNFMLNNGLLEVQFPPFPQLESSGRVTRNYPKYDQRFGSNWVDSIFFIYLFFFPIEIWFESRLI